MKFHIKKALDGKHKAFRHLFGDFSQAFRHLFGDFHVAISL